MGAIVWIASYPKSGNTWTRNFLHNLLRPSDDTYDINEMNDLTTGAAGSRWYRDFLPRPLEDCSLEDVALARPQAQARLASAADGIVFVKSHSAMVNDLGTPSVNRAVTSGAIYIVRNPLDVAVSFASHMGTDIDKAIDTLAMDNARSVNSSAQAYEPMGSWSQHVLSWTHRAHRALHVVRYEDMVAKPEDTFGHLCEFLLLRPSRKELRAAIEKSSFEKLQQQEEERGFKERPAFAARFFREGRVGAWKDCLSPAQIERIVDRHREQMRHFGYLPENPAASPLAKNA